MISAPSASKIKVIFKINPVSRTIPPTFGAEIASCMVLRCFKDIFFPETNATATRDRYHTHTANLYQRNDYDLAEGRPVCSRILHHQPGHGIPPKSP